MATTAQEVLARHFPGLTPAEVDAELSRASPAGASPISSVALNYLRAHGGEEAQAALQRYEESTVRQDQATTAAQILEKLLRSSLTIEQAARALALSRSRISHRISDQSLYAITVQGRRHLPTWQFRHDSGGTACDVIPGLAQIVPAIPPEIHPLAVEVFMTEPLDDLGGNSPVDYLCAYGQAEVIENWFHALGNR